MPITFADMPHADEFTVGILGLVAQRERQLISQRTKAALAAAKAKGRVLGGYRPELTEVPSGTHSRTKRERESPEPKRSGRSGSFSPSIDTQPSDGKRITSFYIAQPM